MRSPIDGLNSTQKTSLLSDAIHAGVVLFVVLCATLMTLLHSGLPSDVIGAVLATSLGYAAGKSGNVRPAPEDDRLVPFPYDSSAADPSPSDSAAESEAGAIMPGNGSAGPEGT